MSFLNLFKRAPKPASTARSPIELEEHQIIINERHDAQVQACMQALDEECDYIEKNFKQQIKEKKEGKVIQMARDFNMDDIETKINDLRTRGWTAKPSEVVELASDLLAMIRFVRDLDKRPFGSAIGKTIDPSKE